MSTNVNFAVINRYKVSINSLKNELKNAKSTEELLGIASKIVELEQKILLEKAADSEKLEKKKKKLETKRDKIKRQLNQCEHELNHVTNTITVKITNYKKVLENRIEALNDSYTILMNNDKDINDGEVLMDE